jgi:hypothetical protein
MLVMSTPGERRLDRPPSDRYQTPPETALPPAGSTLRAIGAGLGAAVAWAALTVVLGGVLTLTAGLLVLAAAGGRLVALAVAWGGGPGMMRGTRLGLVVALVIAGFVLGQVGIWAYGRAEGGVMAPVDYLMTTFGIVVPLQLVIALVVAWWTAR